MVRHGIIMDEFSDVVKKIAGDFDIDGPHDLSPFFDTNGDKWLFSLLQKLYKQRYDNNYRIVLSFDKDQYEYSGTSCGELILALQTYITEVDISHFFIIVISTENRIANELDTIRLENLNHTDQCPIVHYSADNIPVAYNQVNSLNSNGVCVKMWHHLYIATDGTIAPCCLSTKTALGNVLDNNISEIRNNELSQRIRNDMLRGKKPIECKACYQDEKQNLVSGRITANSNHPTAYQYITNNQMNKPLRIDTMDVRISNICNLKCRICSSNCSSRIAKENLDEFYNGQPLNAAQRNSAMADIIKYVPSVSSIYFAGGEPLIMDEHYQIVNTLRENKMLDIPIRYNTNLTVLSYKKYDVIDIWKSMPNLTVGVSVDASGKHAEYLRNGTIWNTLRDNLIHVNTQLPQLKRTIDSTISIHNAFHLMECHQELINDGIINVNDFNVSILRNPPCFCIDVLPDTYKEELKSHIDKHINFLQSKNGNISQWIDIKQYLELDNSHRLYEFFNITDIVDSHRNETFVSVFTEYGDLRKYV